MTKPDIQALEVVDLHKILGGIVSKKIPGGRDLWRRIRNSGYIRGDLYSVLPAPATNKESLAVFEAAQLIRNHPDILKGLDDCDCIKRELRWVLPTVKKDKQSEGTHAGRAKP